MTDLRDMPIGELELSVRATNCLRNAGYKTFGEVYDELQTPEGVERLEGVRNMGRRTINEIRDVCAYVLPPPEDERRAAIKKEASALWDRLSELIRAEPWLQLNITITVGEEDE